MARLIPEQVSRVAGVTSATLKIERLSIKHPLFKKLHEAFEKRETVNFQRSKFYISKIELNTYWMDGSFANIDLLGYGKVYGSTIKYLRSKGLTFELDVNTNPIDVSTGPHVEYDYEKVEEILPRLRVRLETRDTLPEPTVQFETSIIQTEVYYCQDCKDEHERSNTLYSQQSPTKRKAQALHRKWKALLKSKGFNKTLEIIMLNNLNKQNREGRK